MRVALSNPLRRSGFTLVEMLVTFSIIAVLGAMIAAGVMSWMGAQARRNTEAEIRMLHNALSQHWDAVVSEARDDRNIPTAVVTYAGGTNKMELARAIWVKLRLMEAFPVSFEEINNSYTTEPLLKIPANRRRYMAGYKQAIASHNTTNHKAKTESAACLLMALGVSRDGVSHSPDALRPYSRDIDDDGVMELADGWSEPLYFYRFATDNTDLQNNHRPSNFSGKAADPLDPKGLLFDATLTNYDTDYHKRKVDASNAWYSIPVLMSSGADFQIGHNLPAKAGSFAVTSAAQAQDNLYSYKLK